MTPLEKALTWHKLDKWISPNAESVKHVEAILAELERVKAATSSAPSMITVTVDRRPDPALVERLRHALEFGQNRGAIAVPIDVPDVEQLLALFNSLTETPNA